MQDVNEKQEEITKKAIIEAINEYGENNCYISFSGGRDSTILSEIMDKALPHNEIKRVYVDTGLEYKSIKDFVLKKQSKDSRIKIIKPKQSPKEIFEEHGYPFKSKAFSEIMERARRLGFDCPSVAEVFREGNREYFYCPDKLKYLKDDTSIKISDKCCQKLKIEPIKEWEKQNNKTIAITGLTRAEGGRRKTTKFITTEHGKVKKINPLYDADNTFLDDLTKKYNIELCELYGPPFNFTRTGCKGCPINRHIQKDLNILAKYFPEERRQVEEIWAIVYGHYRARHYRLYPEKDIDKSFYRRKEND